MPGSTSQNLKKRMLKSPRLERRNESNKSQEIIKQMSVEILDQNPYELGYTYEDIINFRRNQIYKVCMPFYSKPDKLELL